MKKKPLTISIGTTAFLVEVLPGPLRYDDRNVRGYTLDRIIMISGTVRPDDRLWILLDQIRRIWISVYGHLAADGMAAFMVDVFRQINAQGGEEALTKAASRKAVA